VRPQMPSSSPGWISRLTASSAHAACGAYLSETSSKVTAPLRKAGWPLVSTRDTRAHAHYIATNGSCWCAIAGCTSWAMCQMLSPVWGRRKVNLLLHEEGTWLQKPGSGKQTA
jgi:hypothetical protein